MKKYFCWSVLKKNLLVLLFCIFFDKSAVIQDTTTSNTPKDIITLLEEVEALYNKKLWVISITGIVAIVAVGFLLKKMIEKIQINQNQEKIKTDIEDLQKQLSDLLQEKNNSNVNIINKNQENELKSLPEENRESDSRRIPSELETGDLNKVIGKLKKSIEELEREFVIQKGTYEGLNNIIAEEIKKTLAELEGRSVNQQGGTYEELKTSNAELTKRIGEFEKKFVNQQGGTYEELKTSNEELTKRIGEFEKKFVNQQGTYDGLKTSIIEELTKKIEEFEKKFVNQQGVYQELKTSNEELAKKIGEIENKFISVRPKYSQGYIKWIEENNDYLDILKKYIEAIVKYFGGDVIDFSYNHNIIIQMCEVLEKIEKKEEISKAILSFVMNLVNQKNNSSQQFQEKKYMTIEDNSDVCEYLLQNHDISNHLAALAPLYIKERAQEKNSGSYVIYRRNEDLINEIILSYDQLRKKHSHEWIQLFNTFMLKRTSYITAEDLFTKVLDIKADSKNHNLSYFFKTLDTKIKNRFQTMELEFALSKLYPYVKQEQVGILNAIAKEINTKYKRYNIN